MGPSLNVAAQSDGTSSYGFEWIVDGQQYLKVKTGQSGVYRITGADLAANGLENVEGRELSLLLVGEEVPVFVSEDRVFGDADYLEFYVAENPLTSYQSELYPSGENGMLSPNRALFSDTVAYFLTVSPGDHLRYTEIVQPSTPSVAPKMSAYALSTGPLASHWVAKGFNTYSSQYSSFQDGDGWSFAFTADRNLSYNTPGFTEGGRGILKINTLSSAGALDNRVWTLSIDNTLLIKDSLRQNQFSKYEKILAPGTISGSRVAIKTESLSGPSSRVALGEAELYYEASNLASSRSATVRYAIDPPPTGPYALQWGALPSGKIFKVFDIDGRRCQALSKSGQDFSEFTQVEPGDRFVLSDASTTLTAVFESVDLSVPELSEQTNYLIISSNQLSDWTLGPDDYREFRESAAGGSFDVAAFDVEDLYDVFGYGLPQDARAMRNLILWASSVSAIEHTFIIGKGREFTALRLPGDLIAPDNATAFVPSFGYPASDNLLAVHPVTQQMVSAIGRIPVETSEELDIYLRKVRATVEAMTVPQSEQARAWMKQIVHLGGGSNANEQASIRNRLRQMQRILETNRFGAQTYELYKNSDQPVQQVENDDLFDRINKGASVITFFGHSSPGTFDFNIDDPVRYENQGRYPLMISLGCYSGNMQTSAKSAGERFMLYEDKAAVAFAASVGLGYPSVLQRFASDFYQSFGAGNYSGTVGDAFRVALQKSLSANSYLNQQLAEQFAFQGDPALVLYKHEGADYIIPTEDLIVGPANLAYGIDSLSIDLDVINLGSNEQGKLRVIIERATALRPRAAVDTVYFDAPAARVSLSKTIDAWGREGVGLNTVWATVVSDSITEVPTPAAVSNNVSGGVQFFIRDDGVDPLYPHDLALTDSTIQTFHASTRDPFGQPQLISWQLALDINFKEVVSSNTQSGLGLVTWQPPGILRPNTTYFWRVGLGPQDSLYSTTPRSFSVVSQAPKSDAWGPRSLDQFRAGSNEGYFPDSVGEWQFRNAGFFITSRTKVVESVNDPSFQKNFVAVGGSIIPRRNQIPALGFAIANGDTGEFLDHEDPRLIGSNADFNRFIFHYTTDSREQRAAIVNMLDSIVEEGDYVWVMSLYGVTDTFNFEEWQADSLTTLERTIAGALSRAGAEYAGEWVQGETVPYQLVYRKGYGVISEQLGTSRSDVLTSDVFVELPGGRGKYISPALPTAEDYGRLSYDIEVSSDSAEIAVSLLGTLSDGTVDILLSDSSSTGQFDLSSIDRNAYSSLNIEMSRNEPGEEGKLKAPAYTLEYTPRPELVFDPATQFKRSSDTLSRGAPFNLEVNVRNISSTEVHQASLQARSVGSSAGNPLRTDSLGIMKAWDSRLAKINVPGKELLDSTSILFTLVAENQPEDVRENNIGFLSTYQLRDRTAPTITLLLDGDNPPPGTALVTEPSFEAVLADDNIYDRLDEGSVTFTLKAESGEVFTGNQLPGEVRFRSEENGSDVQKAYHTYEPGELPDGLYTLSVVARDEASNSVRTPAELRFEVVNATAVSNVLPYPNPFVDHVQFQYEATGVPPDDFQIDIYSTSGRLVRSLGPDELGDLKVGRQLTDGFWNATDEYGQRLAKGVYLYRFATQGDDGELDQRETKMDDFIAGGFGKLVIL